MKLVIGLAIFVTGMIVAIAAALGGFLGGIAVMHAANDEEKAESAEKPSVEEQVRDTAWGRTPIPGEPMS